MKNKKNAKNKVSIEPAMQSKGNIDMDETAYAQQKSNKAPKN